jgi:Double zinc ribbon
MTQLLAVLALGVVVVAVLAPVLRQRAGAARPADPGAPTPDPLASDLDEIELDRQMGKLSEDDYRVLRRGIERARAQVEHSSTPPGDAPAMAAPHMGTSESTGPDAAALRRVSQSGPRAGSGGPDFPSGSVRPSSRAASPVPTALDDLAEQLVRQYREKHSTCPSCGDRPEPDSRYCSSCGRVLQPCPGCGHTVEQLGARFCPRCGAALAN